MKNVAIIVYSLSAKKNVHYMKMNKQDKNKNGFEYAHKRKFKEFIYGGIWTYYNEGMDFSKSTIVVDNR